MASPTQEGGCSILLKSFGVTFGDNHHQQQLPTYDHHNSTQLEKLEQLLARLEQERIKIDAFKRELPLCMQLLTDAVETSRQQLQAYKANCNNGNNNNSNDQGPIRPVLEEFLPLKKIETSPDQVANISDKANWMTAAQLWSQDNNTNDTKSTPTLMINTSSKETDQIGFSVTAPTNKLALDTKQRNGGGFLPFSKERNLCPSPILALAPNDNNTKEMMLAEDKKCNPENEIHNHNYNYNNNNGNHNGNGFCSVREVSSCKVSNGGVVMTQEKANSTAPATTTVATGNTSTTTQTHRKARRCWSPDLHRRFVNALQMLGGSQVATPKQIRELMKVDGLTNDEVKSHLQKYRLHTRRPGPTPQAPGNSTTPLVFLGGIWVPPEYTTAAAAAHGGAPTLYGIHPAASHAPPPHFCAASPMPQEFYTAAMTPPLPLPLPPPLPLHVYKSNSPLHSSPESNNKGSRDRSESIEHGKSESSSCKDEW